MVPAAILKEQVDAANISSTISFCIKHDQFKIYIHGDGQQTLALSPGLHM